MVAEKTDTRKHYNSTELHYPVLYTFLGELKLALLFYHL